MGLWGTYGRGSALRTCRSMAGKSSTTARMWKAMKRWSDPTGFSCKRSGEQKAALTAL